MSRRITSTSATIRTGPATRLTGSATRSRPEGVGAERMAASLSSGLAGPRAGEGERSADLVEVVERLEGDALVAQVAGQLAAGEHTVGGQSRTPIRISVAH